MDDGNAAVLVTGGFGTVGAHTLPQLVAQGYQVSCLDIENDANRKKERQLEDNLRFRTFWGDLRREQELALILTHVKPDAIIHLAAVIPPFAYVYPEMAHDVNVTGMRNLILAAQSLEKPPKFIFSSSYSIHGPRNPYRDLPPLHADAPVQPGDNYARHKVTGEEMLRASGLPWTILRLPAVMPVNLGGSHALNLLRFTFLLPLERRQQGIDVRDAGLALANAVSADTDGRTLALGGGEDWQLTGREFMTRQLNAIGIGAMAEAAYRLADPEIDDSWYYEDWVDAQDSQTVLAYQRHSFADYLDHLKRQSGMMRAVVRAASPLLRRHLARMSPFNGKPIQPDGRSHWELVCDLYDIHPGVA